LGHEGYLTEVYRQYSVEDLAKFYRQGEHALLVFGNGNDIAKLRKEVEEKNQQLQQLVNGLTTRNLALEEQLKELQQRVKVMEDFRDEWWATLEVGKPELGDIMDLIRGKDAKNE
jgi:DNA-binding transcriptional MerR regulator